MEICKIKGWEVCIGKDKFKVGDKVVYFPPDCILPLELSEKLNITKYLSNGRVKATNLRGFNSYGTVMPCELDLPIGTDVAEHYGITKWEPPIKATDGDAERPNPVFHTYFSMENLRNFPSALDNKEVYITEKIHGQNARVGLIQVENDKGEKVWSWAAGSHDVQRKQYIIKNDGTQVESVFWKGLTKEVKDFLAEESYSGYNADEIDNNPLVKNDSGINLVLFGERYGSVQDLKYGLENGNYDFRWFDITYNGKYLSSDVKWIVFKDANIKCVPILYEGIFNMDIAINLAKGNTTLGASHVIEGVVICTKNESPCITDKRVFTRSQFKLINPDYLTRKGGSEDH